MAMDTLMLEAFAIAEAVRFRTYGWAVPAFTFGYSQQWEAVRARVPLAVGEVVRRPSGGGVVDHRSDWTYALVLPSLLSRKLPSSELYCLVHKALGKALGAQGQAWQQFSPCEDESSTVSSGALSICFERPAPGDVLDGDGRKIAGAALKRNQHGLLLQGSIEKRAAPQVADWRRFESVFTDELAIGLGLGEPKTYAWEPEATALEAMSGQYASAVWNQKR